MEGLYESVEGEQTPHLLRFFADGTVRAAHNPIALSEATAAAGTAELAGDKLVITTKHRFGTVTYEGAVAADKKQFTAQVTSSITGWKGRLTFRAVH